MNRLHCNLCGAEYYVNPPVARARQYFTAGMVIEDLTEEKHKKRIQP